MSEKHTQGRLHSEANHLVVGSVRIAVVDTPDIHAGVDYYESEANARRLVACWNACEGIGTLQLESLRFPLLDLHNKELDMQQQRDELLSALEGVMYWDNGKPEWDAARAAIAKVKGGAA